MLTMMTLLEGVNHLPIPTWGFFLIAFGMLMLGLAIVWNVGKQNPHA